MSTLSALGGVSDKILVGSSALSLVGLGAALLKPKNPPPGIDGFLFDMPMTESVSYGAQVTDHYTEANVSMQDHVAIDPLKVVIVGKVSELVYTKMQAIAFLRAVIDRLQPLGVIKPQQSLQAYQAISKVETFISAVTTATKVLGDLWSVVSSGQPAKNKQQKAFEVFEQYFLGRAVITVETPWKTYKDMIIESWSVEQGEESIFESTFTINFKQLRTVGTQTNAGKLQGRIEEQKSEVKNTGKADNTTFALDGTNAVGWTK